MMQQLRNRGLALTLAAVIGLGVSLPAWSHDTSTAGETLASFSLAQAGQTKTVAVVDFENHTGSAQNDNLKRGISESLMSKLSQRPELTLVERSQLDKAIKELGFSQSVYANASQAKEIGKMINADYLVTGNVIKAGNRFEINVRMIEVETAKVVVSEGYAFNSENEILPVVDYLSLLIPRKLGFYVSDRELEMAKQRLQSDSTAVQPQVQGDNSWIWWTLGGVVAVGAIVTVIIFLRPIRQEIKQTIGTSEDNPTRRTDDSLMPRDQGLQIPLIRF